MNEKINIPALKSTLRNLGSLYGDVLDVVAHGNIKMRGQAFLVFRHTQDALKCMEDIQGLPLYGKSIHVETAKSMSDVIAMTKGVGEQQKNERLAWKKTQPSLRESVKLGGKHTLKKPKKKEEVLAAGATTFMTATPAGPGDDFLPPNHILFIQNLATSTTQADIHTMFHPFPGFMEVRVVAVRPDIAFVEYENDVQAGFVKDRLQGAEIHGEKIKITFARK